LLKRHLIVEMDGRHAKKKERPHPYFMGRAAGSFYLRPDN
jgi:hypothetical protein